MSARDEERKARAQEQPVVGGLPDVPGIVAAMRLSENLGLHLRGLADALLVEEFPGATLTRAERELIATAVSAGNDCFYCMDSHGAFASALLRRENAPNVEALVDSIKLGGSDGASPKLAALLDVARTVRRNSREVSAEFVARAKAEGATNADTQLAVLIASAFCMYNRMVDGLRAQTPPSAEAYRARAEEIAEHGYSSTSVKSLPR
ncbi:MAG: carboxymuconolactone decarboxylase family protein [Polyangiaceae bacterium]